MSFCSVEEYIDSLSEEGKKYVKWFVEFMEEEYPQLKAKIAFSMPMWWKGEKMREYSTPTGFPSIMVRFSIPSFSNSRSCKVSVFFGAEPRYRKISL